MRETLFSNAREWEAHRCVPRAAERAFPEVRHGEPAECRVAATRLEIELLCLATEREVSRGSEVQVGRIEIAGQARAILDVATEDGCEPRRQSRQCHGVGGDPTRSHDGVGSAAWE